MLDISVGRWGEPGPAAHVKAGGKGQKGGGKSAGGECDSDARTLTYRLPPDWGDGWMSKRERDGWRVKAWAWWAGGGWGRGAGSALSHRPTRPNPRTTRPSRARAQH